MPICLLVYSSTLAANLSQPARTAAISGSDMVVCIVWLLPSLSVQVKSTFS